MENSNYDDSDNDVDLSLNCSVDQSFRLNNSIIEKKNSNNENVRDIFNIEFYFKLSYLLFLLLKYKDSENSK